MIQTLNMVVEIPRFSQAKFEITRDRPLNPIRQDLKQEKSRSLTRPRFFVFWYL